MGDDEQITPDGDYHEDNSHKLRSARFELYGYIRRRAFKQKIMDKTQSLGIRGYCMVHNRDYVSGLIQGRPQQFDEMLYWFSSFESPEIQFTGFGTCNEHTIDDYTFDTFKVHPYKPTK
ncbi:acylphosphatase-1-like isoform X2 [Rhynchophorus ferrugineus]|uniref:acylphosphatase n=1 Tax=Rhynchophorus ferrugineus TaxID=354439 RepID=A0A834IH85_RHYFE|nr:hypothetical protein GWI33_005585 [Rhynchophorus ferrugineus]